MSAKDTVNTKCPLCSIPFDELTKWAEKRYIDNIPTVELLKQAKSEHEKEIITIVGMLDVDDSVLEEIISKSSINDCNVYSCRYKLKRWLKEKTLSTY